MRVFMIGTALLLGATALPPESGAENPFGTVPKLQTLFGSAHAGAPLLGASAETPAAESTGEYGSAGAMCDCTTAESTSSSTTSTVSTAAELTSALGTDAEMIVLKPGVYKLDEELMIKRGVSLWAEPWSVTLDGQDKTRVLWIDAGTALVELHGINIRNGRAADKSVSEKARKDGGGVAINSGNVNFINCQIYNNEALEYGEGGGVFVNAGQVTFTSSNIYGNTAGAGGGVFANDQVTFNNCQIYNNEAHYGGGGVYAYISGQVEAKDLQMWNNSPNHVSGDYVSYVQVYSPPSA